ADVDQRHRNGLSADVELNVAQPLRELEAESDVLAAVAVVVDLDLVSSLGIKLREVGPAVGDLKRHVAGEDRDEILAALLIAVEHVEIGGVDLWQLRDKWRL